MPKIEPRILKGFRDELPESAIQRNELFNKITSIFELTGFSPIDTPALEYTEILLGKGSDETDKQLFRFEDQGGRDVAMRFDLTVPLARYVALHQNEITFPFRRYHIAPVWRAEKPQKGRYREFYQCDFDIIGSSGASSDIEILLVAHRFFSSLEIPYTLKINHRTLLNEILSHFKVKEKKQEALRAIDKLDKIGKEGVIEELSRTTEISKEDSDNLISFLLDLQEEKDPEKSLSQISSTINSSDKLDESIDRLQAIFSGFKTCNISPDNYSLDISIARGLDYYTGIVFETRLDDMPTLGSVCSGGRYDNLSELFTSRSLPGVGGSVGIDRLIVALNEVYNWQKFKTKTKVLVSVQDVSLLDTYLKITESLRENNIETEIYPDSSKLGQQLKYADKKNIPLVIIQGSREAESGEVLIKDFRGAEGKANQINCKIDVINQTIKELLK